MKDIAVPIEVLFQRAEDYGKTTLELLQLKAIDKTADAVSSLVSKLAVIIAATLAGLILNIGIALWIGELLGNAFYGFFIVGGFYALMAGILHIFKEVWIKQPLNNSIIAQMLKQKIS